MHPRVPNRGRCFVLWRLPWDKERKGWKPRWVRTLEINMNTIWRPSLKIFKVCSEILTSSLSPLWQENGDAWVIWKATFEWFTAPGCYASSSPNLSHFNLSLTHTLSYLFLGESFVADMKIENHRSYEDGKGAQGKDVNLPPSHIWYSGGWINENGM